MDRSLSEPVEELVAEVGCLELAGHSAAAGQVAGEPQGFQRLVVAFAPCSAQVGLGSVVGAESAAVVAQIR
jgi:hypothetical protein